MKALHRCLYNALNIKFNEAALFQFLPHSFRALLIMTFNINYFPKATTYKAAIIVSHSTLMFTHNRFKQLFPDAEIQVEKLLGIPKSYTAIKL